MKTMAANTEPTPPLRARIRRVLGRTMTDPVARAIAKTGVTPNQLTLLGFLLAVGTGALLATGHLLVGGILMLVAGVFDMLDGALARASGQATQFGAVLDSVLDRVSEGVVLLGLLIFYSPLAHRQEIILVFLAFVGSVLVSYIKARAEGMGMKCDVGLLTRPERVIILAVGLLAGQVLAALYIVTILSFFTAGQRFFHVLGQSRRAEKPS